MHVLNLFLYISLCQCYWTVRLETMSFFLSKCQWLMQLKIFSHFKVQISQWSGIKEALSLPCSRQKLVLSYLTDFSARIVLCEMFEIKGLSSLEFLWSSNTKHELIVWDLCLLFVCDDSVFILLLLPFIVD